jgi:sarcosine oxidase subunit gamma
VPEFQLKASPALGGTAAGATEIGPFRLEENTGFALASLALRTGDARAVRSAVDQVLGFAAPGPGSYAAGDEFAAFWMSPDQWMVCASLDGNELLASQLKDKLGGQVSVSEQNDGWVCLDVEGPDLAGVFERLVNVDVHDLKQGTAVRTVIEHVGCFLICLESGHRYRLFAGRSFAHSLHHAVAAGLRSTVALNKLEPAR